ncbi:MAG: aminodeoxychorismate/anthranilate synthase component II [Planctomycetota bacterium]
MILLIDNYDSFTFNLQRILRQLEQDVVVCRNDKSDLAELAERSEAMILSPGPKAPRDAGDCLEIVREHSGRVPILGVCLGHQVIYEAFGGEVVRAKVPMHGRMDKIQSDSSRLFEGIPSGASFARYHSLVGCSEEVPAWLRVTAWSEEGEMMAVEHREHLTFGVQFHPESILSLHGPRLLQNFLQSAGLPSSVELPASDLRNPQQVSAPVDSDSYANEQETATMPPAEELLLTGKTK